MWNGTALELTSAVNQCPDLWVDLSRDALLLKMTARRKKVVYIAAVDSTILFFFSVLTSVLPSRVAFAPHSGQTQKSIATSGFRPRRTLQEFKEKTCKAFQGKCYKLVLGEKITSWESLGISFSKFPGHMRGTKFNFSATVLTLGFKAKISGNLRIH